MKKNARILSFLLSVVMVCGMIVVPTMAADAKAAALALSITDPVGEVAIGDTVEVTASLTSNTGFVEFVGNIDYSEDTLTFVKITAVDNEGIDIAVNEENFNVSSDNATEDYTASNVKLFVAEFTVKAAGDIKVDVVVEEVIDVAADDVAVTVAPVTAKVEAAEDSTPEDGEKDEPAGDDTIPTPVPTPTPEGGNKDNETEDSTDPAVFCKTEVEAVPAEENVPEELKKAAGETAEFFDVVLKVTECKAGLEEEPEEKPEDSTPNQPTGNTPVEDGSDTDVDGDTVTTPNTPNQPTGNGTPVDGDTDTDTDTDTATPNPTPNTPNTPNGDGTDGEAGDTDVDHSNCETRLADGDERDAFLEENGKFTVEVDLPEGVSAETHTIKVLAFVNGEVVEVEFEITEEGKVSFELDGFYPVALCWNEIVEEVEEEEEMVYIPRLLPVTVTVEEGAKVNTNAKFLIAYGAKRTIKITAEEGFEVTDIVVNGKSVGAADTYTLKGVVKAQNIVIKTAKVVVEDAE